MCGNLSEVIISVFPSGRVSVTFLVYAGNEVMKGTQVVSLLRHHMLTDSSELLDLPLLSVDNVVCQNNCSGNVDHYIPIIHVKYSSSLLCTQFMQMDS